MCTPGALTVVFDGASDVSAQPAGRRRLSIGERAARLAARQRSKPYAWGASGPRAFDSSGLAQYVYGRLGIQLPRTAARQFAAVTTVPATHKRPGDLIFSSGWGGVRHVGIYAGNGRLWTAAHTGDTVALELMRTTHYLVGRPG